MWIGVLWTGLRVAMWIAHVGGKHRHGLLEKSFIKIPRRRCGKTTLNGGGGSGKDPWADSAFADCPGFLDSQRALPAAHFPASDPLSARPKGPTKTHATLGRVLRRFRVIDS